MAQMVKNLPAIQETLVQSLSREYLEKGTATHSSILAWRSQWTEERHADYRQGVTKSRT